MNWILVVVLLIFGIFMIRGWHRGLLRILFSLVSVIVLIFLVQYTTPYVSDYIKNNTSVYQTIEQRCENTIQEKVEQQIETTGSTAENTLSLPTAVSSFVQSQGENALEESGVYESAGSKMADWILKAAAFLIALLLAVILIAIISHALKLVDHIPVIKGVNRTLGLLAGVLQGYIVVSIVFLALALLSNTAAGQTCIAQIDDNPVLKFLYYHNVLANLILK